MGLVVPPFYLGAEKIEWKIVNHVEKSKLDLLLSLQYIRPSSSNWCSARNKSKQMVHLIYFLLYSELSVFQKNVGRLLSNH